MYTSYITYTPILLSAEKSRCQYLARLLINGGTKLLREKFDSIHKPENLRLTLNDPAVKGQLSTVLDDLKWNNLYSDPAKHVSSADFDLWLILKLLRTICGLTPLVTGWYAMPRGVAFVEDLARIECYCRFACYREMTDARFNYLWSAISKAFLRIAASISSDKRGEWENSIDELRQDPLRFPEVDYVFQLRFRGLECLICIEMISYSAPEWLEYLFCIWMIPCTT